MAQVDMILIGLLLMIISGVANAVMDKIQFHFHDSIFRNMGSWEFWNPEVSWSNKWKDGCKDKGERFFLSSTVLVFTTDAWHLFKFVRVNSLIIGSLVVGLGVKDMEGIWIVSIALVVIVLHKLTFEIFFSKVFTLK